LVFLAEVRRHLNAEDETVAARQEMRRLSLVGAADIEPVVGTDRHVDLFFPVPVHVAEQEVLRPVRVLLPALVGRRDVLTLGVGQGLCTRIRREREQHHRDRLLHSGLPVNALSSGLVGMMLHSGQPMTLSFFVTCRWSRRFAISSWNCSSVNATRMPRSMNMFATERLPEPCQLRGSGTFLFDGELSM